MATEERKKIFGTDGVRGRANRYPMTVEVALSLGRAAGKLFRSHEGKHRVVIGKDTRLSCYMFENALIAGLNSMGVDTLMLGPFPTPGVAFITRAYRADAGIVISASHNPYIDNGIKFFSSEGYKLPDAWEREIEAIVDENHFSDWLPADDQLGRNAKVSDADGRYIEFVKAAYPKRSNLEGLKIVIDCANGATYRVAPLVLKELDADVKAIGCGPNGLNINLGCGSLSLDAIKKKVVEEGADLGIALDGDGDRVIMIDEKGNVVDGDKILGIAAKDLKKRGGLKNDRIVATVMSNLGFIHSMKESGIEVIESEVGDRKVIQEMLNHDALLGGEKSGHLIFLDHNTTGDGLVASLQVMRIMKENGATLSSLAGEIAEFPQVLANVKVSSKPPLESLDLLQNTLEEAEKQLGENGRVLIRYSGTENVCRVMVEGPTQSEAAHHAGNLAKAIEQQIG